MTTFWIFEQNTILAQIFVMETGFGCEKCLGLENKLRYLIACQTTLACKITYNNARVANKAYLL